jgi:hydrogenase-4 membrane subunit HyfE
VSSFVLWPLVALGLAVVVARQRSLAVGLVTVQALVLVATALDDAHAVANIAAGLALLARALALAALFFVLVSRSQETQPVRAGVGPLSRAAYAIGLALLLCWLVPRFGLASRDAERASLSLVAFGLVTACTRRALLLQVLGVVLAENGLALAALELPGAPAVLIELGVALDVTLIGLVAAAFHARIFAEFGTGDSALLRGLRD